MQVTYMLISAENSERQSNVPLSSCRLERFRTGASSRRSVVGSCLDPGWFHRSQDHRPAGRYCYLRIQEEMDLERQRWRELDWVRNFLLLMDLDLLPALDPPLETSQGTSGILGSSVDPCLIYCQN